MTFLCHKTLTQSVITSAKEDM